MAWMKSWETLMETNPPPTWGPAPSSTCAVSPLLPSLYPHTKSTSQQVEIINHKRVGSSLSEKAQMLPL